MNDETRQLLSLAPIGISKVSREGKFLSANRGYCEITGYSEIELLGKTYQQITHPDDLESDEAEADRTSADPDSDGYSMVKRYVTKDGRIVWVNLHVFPIREANKEFKYFLSFAIEIFNIGVCSPNTEKQTKRPNISITELVLKYPKESVLFLATLITVLKGDDIAQLFKLIFNK